MTVFNTWNHGWNLYLKNVFFFFKRLLLLFSLPICKKKSRKCRLCECVAPPPGGDEVQQMLPALADFVELVLDLGGFVVLAGLGQALAHRLQLLLVLLSHADLLLVVLGRTETIESGSAQGQAEWCGARSRRSHAVRCNSMKLQTSSVGE